MVVGESVLIFGKRGEGGVVSVVAGGQGKFTLEAKTREEAIAGAGRVIEIAALKEEDAKNRAMLREVGSGNGWLRAVAINYVRVTISDSKLRENYKPEFVAMLQSEDAAVQRAGLEAIRFVQAKEMVPRIIELTRSKDLGVMDSASLALGPYVEANENEDVRAVAALIALTQEGQPRAIRVRAIIDLSDCGRPEAKAALGAILTDKDVEVRRYAPRGLVFLLRQGMADDLLPKLAALMKDKDEEVSVRAAETMGETKNVEAALALVEMLKVERKSRALTTAVLRGLSQHYSRNEKGAREAMEPEIQRAKEVLKAGKAGEGNGAAFQAVGLLAMCRTVTAMEALTEAAEAHPDVEIREYAKQSLK